MNNDAANHPHMQYLLAKRREIEKRTFYYDRLIDEAEAQGNQQNHIRILEGGKDEANQQWRTISREIQNFRIKFQ